MRRLSSYSLIDISRFCFYAGCISIAQLIARPVYRITLSDLFYLFSLIIVSFNLLISKSCFNYRIPFTLTIGVVTYLAGALLSAWNSSNVVSTIGVALKLGYLTLIWFWLGTTILQKKTHVLMAAMLWLISVGITGFAATLQIFWPSIIVGTYPPHGRMTGFTGHPNDLGAICSVALPAIWYFIIFHSKTVKISIVSILLLVFIVAGLILSGSVGGLIAASLGMFFWLIIGFRIKKNIFLFTAIGLLIICFIITGMNFGNKTAFHRIREVFDKGGPGGGTWYIRLEGYRLALKSIKNDPFLGVGAIPGGALTDINSAVHNYLLGGWYESGILGLIGIVIITFMSIKMGYYNIKRSITIGEKYFAICLLLSAISFFTYSMGAPGLYQRYGWISVALIVSLRAVQLRNLSFSR